LSSTLDLVQRKVLSIITRHWIDKRYNYTNLDCSSCRCHYEYEDRIRSTNVGRDSSVQRHPTGCTVRGSSLGGDEIFRNRSGRPWRPPSLLYNGYRISFPEVKRPGLGVDHTPCSAEVKERVELYLYSHSGPSWPVLG